MIDRFSRPRFTHQGQVNLGIVVRRSRNARKPNWNPVRGDLSDAEYENLVIEEREQPWTLLRLAEILNREYGLPDEEAYDYHKMQSLEKPPISRKEPSRQLIRDILDLEICINPATGQPFTEEEFDLICQERMDINGNLIAPIPTTVEG